MSRITINSNISSLNTQRSLFNATKKVQDIYTRLSSGLRVNKASDDAAGLAISENLKADTRIQNQGIKNLNDGVSLLNIADGALNELSNIMIRLNELAEQASNGTLANKQRLALDQEAQSLSKEYNRIARTTEFNGRKIFDGDFGDLSLAAGGGSNTLVVDDLGGGIGDGTFNQYSQMSVTANLSGISLKDVNNDNNLDLITTSAGSGLVDVKLGNGDGSFNSNIYQASGGGNLGESKILDINNDGFDDIVLVNYSSADMMVFHGNGNGTFKSRISYDVSSTESIGGNIIMEDINSDGNMDAVLWSANKIYTLLGNSNGTFKVAQSYNQTVDIYSVDIGDFNNDGAFDLVYTSNSTSTYNLIVGNANGTFNSATSYSRLLGGVRGKAVVADFNQDGNLDLSFTNEGNRSVDIFIGNGDLSFQAQINYGFAVNNPQTHTVGDFNGDGNLDIAGLSTTSQGISVILGNANGTFKKYVTYALPFFATSLVTSDINNDGALDILAGATSNLGILLGNQNTGVSALQQFSLRSKNDSRDALDYFRASLNRLSLQRGHIGAFQSRVETATSNLFQSKMAYQEATSRITDVDVAEESSKLVAAQIIQQAAVSILAQANQQPSLTLYLLGGIK